MLALIWISVFGCVFSGCNPLAFAFLSASAAGEVPKEGRGDYKGTEAILEEGEFGMGTEKPTPFLKQSAVCTNWHRHTGYRTRAASEHTDNYATLHR